MSALKKLFSGPAPSPEPTTPVQSPVAQQLQHLEEEQAAQASGSGPSPAVVSQPDNPPVNGRGDKDYRLSCTILSRDPSVQRCRSFTPGASP
jgi:hypothetical protein